MYIQRKIFIVNRTLSGVKLCFKKHQLRHFGTLRSEETWMQYGRTRRLYFLLHW